MTSIIRRFLTFRTEHERGRFWSSAALYTFALFLLVCAAQARPAPSVDGGPDTPPARFAFPPAARIAGAGHQTAAESRVLAAVRAGDTAAAMRRMAPLMAYRFTLPSMPASYTCAGRNPSRFTCAMRAGRYQVVTRVMVAPDSDLVVTRGWVRYQGTPIASAWSAERAPAARELARTSVFSLKLRSCARWLRCIRRPADVASVSYDVRSRWSRTGPSAPRFDSIRCSHSTDGRTWNTSCSAGLGRYATAVFRKVNGGAGALFY